MKNLISLVISDKHTWSGVIVDFSKLMSTLCEFQVAAKSKQLYIQKQHYKTKVYREIKVIKQEMEP